jgi:hypothetical protein
MRENAVGKGLSVSPVSAVVVERSPWYGSVWYGLELAAAAPESQTRWSSKHKQTSKRDLWVLDSASTN